MGITGLKDVPYISARLPLRSTSVSKKPGVQIKDLDVQFSGEVVMIIISII